MRSVRQVVEYLVIALVTALGTASIIAWGLDALGVFPFSTIATIIGVNNFVAAGIIGPILLYFLYEPAARAGMTYPAVMGPEQLQEVPAGRRRLAAWGIAAVAVAWFVLGVLVSLAFEGVRLGAMPGGDAPIGAAGSPIQLVLGAAAFLALLGFALVSGDRLSQLYRARRE